MSLAWKKPMEQFVEDSVKEVRNLQRAIHYEFSQVKLLVMALTHSSFANENDTQSNERMEFLGDAVVEICISTELYNRFPDIPEGELTRLRANLVSEPGLARIARNVGLGDYLFLGKGEAAQGGRERDSVLSDALEAVLGAVYLDGGFRAVQQCIGFLFASFWPACPEKPRPKDYKSKLQELTQKYDKARPTYRLVSSEGPEHAKVYVVQVTLPSGTTLEARDTSLKKAEQKAARNALDLLQDTPA
jgi:ribonuclease-3